MAKLTAWLVTAIGVLLVLPLIGINQIANYQAGLIQSWIIALAVLAIGIGKLMRNYSKKRR